jgi:hypothetical protein
MTQDLYEILSDNIAAEIDDEVANEDGEVSEKEVDNMIQAKASEICPGNIDHYDVMDKAKEKINCWGSIIPYGA